MKDVEDQNGREETARDVGAALARRHRGKGLSLRDVENATKVRTRYLEGLEQEEVDVVMLYDAFTINPVLSLENFGFREKGEGGEFVFGERIAPGGELAVDTNGGGLSYEGG